MEKEILDKLFELSDEKYKKFHKTLCPGTYNIIGVRTPLVRRLAKEIYTTMDWKKYLEYNPSYYEEIVVQGAIIGYIKNENIDIILKYIEKYIPKITNWASCDLFCSGLKITKKYEKEVWNFLQTYLKSNKEFEIRFAIVMILSYFIKDEYLTKIFKIFDSINNDEYYVQMAIAWAISICYIKFKNETENYLKNAKVDNFTYNKALQKITESYRVSKENKEKIRKMKR